MEHAAVLEKFLAVVRNHHDQGRREETAVLQAVEEPAEPLSA
jgi:hypothetical protein